MGWTSTQDFQTMVEAMLRERGAPQRLQVVVDTVAEHMGHTTAEARTWIREYLRAEIEAFSQILEAYPIQFISERKEFVTLRDEGTAKRASTAIEVLRVCAPYVGARLLHSLYAERSIAPPFPSIEEVGQDIGFTPEYVADSIRVAALLPPHMLIRAGILWEQLRRLDHETLVNLSLSGTLGSMRAPSAKTD